MRSVNHSSRHGAYGKFDVHKRRFRNISRMDRHYGSYIARVHDSLLRRTLKGEKYLKLYSYHYLINGFAVYVTPLQADKLSRRREVANVVMDFSVRTATTHTPQFLGLPQGAWDYASPFDGDGHGTHTASVAAGNHGVPVVVSGHCFGNASGMAPRSHVAVYKALYKSFGGFAADVVAAIDQAAQDGVDIISLSITPNRRPSGIATFFNPIDMALLSAVKAGIFVVQATGNTGPSPKSVSSFSPWIFTVGAASHDRIYSNSIVLGNNVTIQGVGLAPSFRIILRGEVVEHQNIANDLKFLQFIVYKPQNAGAVEGQIITAIGFLKEAPNVNIHGFNVYHKNRLILVAVFVGGVDTSATETKGTVLIHSADQLENYVKTEEAKVEELVKAVDDSSARVIVSGAVVGVMALHFCERYKSLL